MSRLKVNADQDWKLEVVTADATDDADFDLEEWLADLLVDHWLSQRGRDEPT